MQGRPLYSSAILLVRNPLDALVSEWNRKKVLEDEGRSEWLLAHSLNRARVFLVGGVCYDRNVGDMPVLVKVFRKLGL